MENNYPIPQNILKEFDIAGLMDKMGKADWYYEYSDDRYVWERGTIEIQEIKDRLLEISKVENGMSAANYLWDAYAPIHSVSKPDFLLEQEGLAMTGQNVEELRKQMMEIGLRDLLQDWLDYHRDMKIRSFVVGQSHKQDETATLYEFRFKSYKNDTYNLTSYTIHYRPPIEIPQKIIGGVDLKELDKDLAGINWAFDPFRDANVPDEMLSKEERDMMVRADSTLNKLDHLVAESEEGKHWGELLMYKHWTQGYYARFVPRREEQREQYEQSLTVAVTGSDYPRLPAVLDVLKKQAPRQIEVEQQDYSIQLKSLVMNEKNFDYLSKQIQFTGFGEGHKDELMQKMKENKPEFTIFHQQDFGKDSTVATLQFRRPEDGDMYFFNRYSLLLKGPKHEEPIKQTFYINNDMKKKEQEDITLKEGYNLLSGRAVEKDLVNKNGEKYTAWVQLDFKVTDKHGNYEEKKFHQNYGYDLEQLLAKHPIKELNTIEDKKKLMESLQRGNRQAVTFQIEGKEQRIFIEAAPQFKSINMYDSGMKRVNAQSLRESNGEEQAQKQDKKESLKVNNSAAGDDESPAQSEKKGRKKGQKVS